MTEEERNDDLFTLDDKEDSQSFLGQFFNVTDDESLQSNFTEPLPSTAALLNRARQFLPQIAAANLHTDWESASFVEVIDKNENNGEENTKKRKRDQSIIEMNLAMGVFEERQNKRPNFVTDLDEQDNNESLEDDDNNFELRLPNYTDDVIQRQNEQDNNNAVVNIINALFDTDGDGLEPNLSSNDDDDDDDEDNEGNYQKEEEDQASGDSDEEEEEDV